MKVKLIKKFFTEELGRLKEELAEKEREAEEFYNSGKVIDAESEMDYYLGYCGRIQNVKGRISEVEFLLKFIG